MYCHPQIVPFYQNSSVWLDRLRNQIGIYIYIYIYIYIWGGGRIRNEVRNMNIHDHIKKTKNVDIFRERV